MQPGDKDAQGTEENSMSINTWREGTKRMDPSSFQWYLVPESLEAMGTS